MAFGSPCPPPGDRCQRGFLPGSRRGPGARGRRGCVSGEGVRGWVRGGPEEKALAGEIIADTTARDLTGNDLRNAILALATAALAVSNDSGLLHVAAALGTPTVGIFGPTSPWHCAPLNPLAATIQTASKLDCRPCHNPGCRLVYRRCMRGISVAPVALSIRQPIARAPA